MFNSSCKERQSHWKILVTYVFSKSVSELKSLINLSKQPSHSKLFKTWKMSITFILLSFKSHRWISNGSLSKEQQRWKNIVLMVCPGSKPILSKESVLGIAFWLTPRYAQTESSNIQWVWRWDRKLFWNPSMLGKIC